MRSVTTRWLYLSGFGTGSRSTKGAALAAWLSRRGVDLRSVDLRVPTFRGMRLRAMIDAAHAALGDATRAVVVGTSLGGWVAASLAEVDPRVEALVLYAPAVHPGALREQHRRVAWLWRRVGYLPVPDKTERRLRVVDVGLLDELERLSPSPPDVRAPTLVVHGFRDRLVHVEGSRLFAAGRSNVRLVEVADGHALRRSWGVTLRETAGFLAPWLPAPRQSRFSVTEYSN